MDNNTTELILYTINTLLDSLFSSIDNAIYPILDKLLFIDTSILKTSNLEKIITGILLIANSLILGVILYYAIKYFLSRFTGTEVEPPHSFLFKIILYAIIMNASFFICEQIISLISIISLSIKELGESIFNETISFTTLINIINSKIYISDSSFSLFSLDGILKSFVSIGIFNLLLSYSLRYVMIKAFILICPFAILTLSNKSTSWFFNTWLRMFLSLLFLQLLVAIIMIIPYSIKEVDIFNKIVLIGCIYALIKANDFVREFMGGLSTNIQTGLSFMNNMFRR